MVVAAAPRCTCGHDMGDHRFLQGACRALDCNCTSLVMPVFVFGSNLAGVHGAGSALHAKKYLGALTGVGSGRMGHSYAIPTKDRVLRVLPLDKIRPYVIEFLSYARAHVETTFDVVEIGCGLAGYRPADIAPMFTHFSSNVNLPMSFRQVLHDHSTALARH